ncbi:MAG: hypothetical protein JSW26_00255 [Desulfobacterales bacterium]|nr:MAG: hypothetical protein JSW26_00255 [Desulfobacterales bacterium]
MNSNHSKKFGHLLVDFINADSTEKALHSFLYNLQQHFSFSTDFYERIKNLFPSINIFAASLNNDEYRLLELILMKKGIVEKLNDQFKLINYSIENYDPFSRTISLISLEWNRDSAGKEEKEGQMGAPEPDGGGFLQTLNLLGLSIVDGPVSIKVDAIRSEIEELLGPLAAGQINNLIEAGHAIEELIRGLPARKYEALQSLAEEHRELINFHKKVGGIQSDCEETLRMLMGGRPYHDIPPLIAFLEKYNTAEYQRLIIADNNRLVAVFPIDERKYFAIREIEGWLDALQKVIAYCLIEFLKSAKNINYLKKCRACSRYFIARQPKRQKFCRKACREKRQPPAISTPYTEVKNPDPKALPLRGV